VNLLEKQLSTVYFKDVKFPVGHPVYSMYMYIYISSE